MLKFRIHFRFIFAIILTFNLNFVFGQIVDSLNLEELTLKARQKAFELGENISLIGNKNTEKSVKRALINRTMDIFINGDCQIEVTSLRDTTLRKKEKIRKYLNRIADLSNYNSVEINWSQIHVIEKIHKKEDGNYWGVIRILQKFEGKDINGKDLYKDVTEKEIEVKLEKLDIEKGIKLDSYFVLKFGGLKVIETNNITDTVKP